MFSIRWQLRNNFLLLFIIGEVVTNAHQWRIIWVNMMYTCLDESYITLGFTVTAEWKHSFVTVWSRTEGDNIQYPIPSGLGLPWSVCVRLSLELAPVYYGPVLSSNNRAGEIDDLALAKRSGWVRAFIRSQRWIKWNYSCGSKLGGFSGDVVRTQRTSEPRVTWSFSFCMTLVSYSDKITFTGRGWAR